MAPQERSPDTPLAGGGPPSTSEIDQDVALALQGDAQALGRLLQRSKERLRRIVAIRFHARLARLLDGEQGLEDQLRASLLSARNGQPSSLAGLMRWMAAVLERELRRGDGARDPRRDLLRALHFEASASAEPRRLQREDLERLVDARVAELAPEELREVLILRDYCGADWQLVRERLGLRSSDDARELYRRAHDILARRLRSHQGR